MPFVRLLIPVLFFAVSVFGEMTHAKERVSTGKPKTDLKVGVSSNPPIRIVRDGQMPTGLAVDILNHVAEAENWHLDYVVRPWSQLLTLLEQGEIDLIAGVGYSDKRRALFSFADEALLANWAIVYRNKDFPVDDILDLSGARVASSKRDVHLTAFRQLATSFGFEFTHVPAKNRRDILKIVAEGGADVGIIPRTFHLLRGFEFEAIPTSIIFNPIQIRFAATLGRHADVLARLDDFIREGRTSSDSEYRRMLNQWLGQVTERAIVPSWIYAIIASIVFVVIGVLVANRWLAGSIDRRTSELQASETKFRLLAENIREVFWIASHDWSKLYYVSPSYEAVWGLPEEALYSNETAWIRSVHPNDRHQIIRSIKAVDRNPDQKISFPDFRIVRADGDIRWISARAYKVADNGTHEPRVVGIAEDITHRKEVEETLSNSMVRLEEANRAKSEFIATMSHEFRTPLNAILGFSEMMRAQYFGPLGGKNYEEYANDIHNSGEHLLALVNDILDISAIEAGKRTLEKEPTDIVEVINACIRTVAKAAEDREIKISLRSGDDLPQVLVDKRAVSQIILNVLSNAVKYNIRGGSVAVSVDRAADGISIAIRDTGVGIDAESLQSITEPFRQTHANPHWAEEGTGLGLAIVKALVEAHAGSLNIESERDAGTTVTVRLPL